MKTPIQQLKENYYKMSESEFHYWMSQNIETLLKEERNIIVGAYNRDVINRKQNWAITDGEKYYNLHYSDQKYTWEEVFQNHTWEDTLEQEGINIEKNQLDKPDQNYTFEDGV